MMAFEHRDAPLSVQRFGRKSAGLTACRLTVLADAGQLPSAQCGLAFALPVQAVRRRPSGTPWRQPGR
jgi:hypothetical protein